MKKETIYSDADLSPREKKVILLLGEGKTAVKIATDLGFSLKAVHSYIGRAKIKLRLENMHQLMRVAVLLRVGLLSIKKRA